MAILDSRREINNLDKHHLLDSIEQLPDQLADAWRQLQSLSFPESYYSVKNIVVSGMGGSALATHVIKHLYKHELRLPLEVSSNYELPGSVTSDTLVILSSYSGNTEETLASARSALEVGAKIAVVTAGGQLAKLARDNNWPLYQIIPTYNASNQPRMAIGYTVVGQLALFNKLGITNVAEQEILNLVDNLKELVKKLSPEEGINTAKLISYSAFDKEIVLIGAEHLVGAVHVTNNQLNENAKVQTAEWPLPEFNHHYLEALSHPGKLREDIIYLLYNSSLYSSALSRRVELTARAIRAAGYEAEIIQATAPSKLEQVFEIITLGSFISFYLAMLYKIDPAPIPRVDWFKSQMNKV